MEKIKSKYLKDPEATVAIAYKEYESGFKVFFANYVVLPRNKYLAYISILEKYGLTKEIVHTRSRYGKKEIWKASTRYCVDDVAKALKNQNISVSIKGKEF